MAPKQSSLRRLMLDVSQRPLLLGIALVLTVAQVGLTLYVPVLVGRFIDAIGMNAVGLSIIWQLLMTIGLATLFQWVTPLLYNQIVYRLIQHMRQQAMQRIQDAPMEAVDRFAMGDLVSRLTTDLEQLSDGLMMVLTQFVSGVLLIIVTMWMMWRMDGLMFGLVLVLTPLSLVVARFIARKSYQLFQAQTKTRSQQTELVEETVRQMTLVQQLSATPQMVQAFDEANTAYRQATLGATFYASTVNPITRFINALIYAALIAVGAWRVVQAAFSIGELVTFLSYATQYTKPFNDISGVLAELQGALACAERIYQLMDLPQEQETGSLVLDGSQSEVSLTFEKLAFRYQADVPLIQDFTLDVPSGAKVAIVGPTGAGKSTMMNLLMRFYDPTMGQIKLDGQAITDYTLGSWRQLLGMVPQETWLISGTIHDNIAYAMPEATRQQVEAAAVAAKADYFIRQLPQGYDTYLHAAGANLSEGQRQLLAIARVFLKPPKILILDEATSSIDAYTEQLVQSTFDVLMEGRTSFVIAHRLATIRSADLIVVMNHGDIVEQGTHQQLMALGGVYATMQQSVE